ncbi:Patatin-like phospholipase domain-containing protein, partial [Neolecta irregularis DAH-3]
WGLSAQPSVSNDTLINPVSRGFVLISGYLFVIHSPKPMTEGDPTGFLVESLPDFHTDFVDSEGIEAYRRAISAPEHEDVELIKAHNDWKPLRESITLRRKRSRRFKAKSKAKDEIREGWTYHILRWPVLILVFGWIWILGLLYFLVRFYVNMAEYYWIWTGIRYRMRERLRAARTYQEWKDAAMELDTYLGHDEWKKTPGFAYYDHSLIRKVLKTLQSARQNQDIDLLKSTLQACVKANFGGIESARLYSQTYYGTKDLVAKYIDEVEHCLRILIDTRNISKEEKRGIFRAFAHNYGRTALCLSGGASYSFYHLGLVKALLDAKLLPNVITGTSGGSLIAALICIWPDKEQESLLIPALAQKLTAFEESFKVYIPRWYKTGARFDPVNWAKKCSWFTQGNTTFKEAYERTGRILNVSIVPNETHSPSKLVNYITAPDCVIWSSLIASAAVPGIIPPVTLMMKRKDGSLTPYNFGNKWKDGSLRTDIPIQSLNMHFNVNFTIVSQVNPHVSLFFFSSRGAVGRPVSHRRGKGWRGGFLGSALEQYIKLDLNKWLRVLRDLELLPKPAGSDYSNIWLQKFEGNVTIWPRTRLSDLWHILDDPSPERLAHMLWGGQRVTFPKLLFISHRLRIERLIEKGRALSRQKQPGHELPQGTVLSGDEVEQSLANRIPKRPKKSVFSRPNLRESKSGDNMDLAWSSEEQSSENEADEFTDATDGSDYGS